MFNILRTTMSSDGLPKIRTPKRITTATNAQSNQFHCSACNYSTNRKSSFQAHTVTQKHLNTEQENEVNVFACKHCNKTYKSRSGMWRHGKLCAVNVGANEITATAATDVVHHAPFESNSELTNAIITLIKQNQEFQTQLFEMAKECKNITNHNNTITNHNTHFNLNIFLNEKCKDAINMVDFVESLHLQMSDLEETGKLGYSNGMSRIFINGLKDMDVCKRPIHCSDLKRETLYIKEDDVWEKDNEERDKIKKAIRKIEQKNIQQIPLWIKAHPNCVISANRDSTPYLNMVMQSTGGANPDETANMNKIISNIAREVVINK